MEERADLGPYDGMIVNNENTKWLHEMTRRVKESSSRLPYRRYKELRSRGQNAPFLSM